MAGRHLQTITGCGWWDDELSSEATGSGSARSNAPCCRTTYRWCTCYSGPFMAPIRLRYFQRKATCMLGRCRESVPCIMTNSSRGHCSSRSLCNPVWEAGEQGEQLVGPAVLVTYLYCPIASPILPIVRRAAAA